MTIHKTDTPEMFTSIAGRYDLLNRVLSFGIDGRWRKRLVEAARVTDGCRVLDVATGTADVAIEFANRSPARRVVGLDRSTGMLEEARRKLNRRGLSGRIEIVEGEALELPFADGSFDVVSIAFGLRNLPDFEAGVAEMTRVLARGGRLLILEFFPPAGNGLFSRLYRSYLGTVLPAAGRVISRSGRAYDYLGSSIRQFATRSECLAFMETAGLDGVRVVDLTGGVSSICSGVKP
jgi:demethylmenaquinone methyltransferase/2-methoxy-6-polyprenyl-1,4-benzoquinol methylase